MKLFQRMEAWWRLYRIYLELGYIPWRKPKKPRKAQERREKRKQRKERKQRGTVYMGTREAMIPFLNKDAKRTIADLILRPGYLMRDYIQRGKHEQYLAPFTALLVFYSVFTLLTAVVQPGASRDTFGDSLLEAVKSEEEIEEEGDAQVDEPRFEGERVARCHRRRPPQQRHPAVPEQLPDPVAVDGPPPAEEV